ncbi:MAG TPA: hypothetical protein VKP69_32380 [Isosphaeraceae bacterium]|nr:hypothetical protein [Isosphaeraceae bacterium]
MIVRAGGGFASLAAAAGASGQRAEIAVGARRVDLDAAQVRSFAPR